MAELEFADEYFNRSYRTVRDTPTAERRVVYGVFCRRPGVLCGIQDVIEVIDSHCPGPVTVRGLSDGDRYGPCEIVLLIEGPFGQLVVLETVILGLLSLSAAAGNMAAICEAAGGVSVVDMSARHYPPELIERIALAAAVGGAAGTSTRAGHAAVLARYGASEGRIRIGQREPRAFGLYGTIPHALNAVYEGDSIASARAYRERVPEVPLTVLLDFEGREREVCAAAVRAFGDQLAAVRLDVPGNRVHQGGHAQPQRALEMRILSQVQDRAAAQQALERYGFGPGVTIESVYAIRDLLDSLNARHTKIMVSSGFNLDKVRAFKACRAPMDAIGTGSWVDFAIFTSDILRVHEDGRWVPRCKAGRRDELVEPQSLPVLLDKAASEQGSEAGSEQGSG